MRYRGNIGIRSDQPIETEPGIFKLDIKEVEVSGDVYPNQTHWPNAKASSASLNMIISFLPPETPAINFSEIVYAIFQQKKWSVVGIEYQRPRVKLRLGGLYNG